MDRKTPTTRNAKGVLGTNSLPTHYQKLKSLHNSTGNVNTGHRAKVLKGCTLGERNPGSHTDHTHIGRQKTDRFFDSRSVAKEMAQQVRRVWKKLVSTT